MIYISKAICLLLYWEINILVVQCSFWGDGVICVLMRLMCYSLIIEHRIVVDERGFEISRVALYERLDFGGYVCWKILSDERTFCFAIVQLLRF